MFAARCIGVSLAVFVLVYVSLSVAVGRGWKLIRGIVRPRYGSRCVGFAVHSARPAAGAVFRGDVGFYLAIFLAAGTPRDRRSDRQRSARAGLLLSDPDRSGNYSRCEGPIESFAGAGEMAGWFHTDGLSIMESGNPVPIFRTGNDAPTITLAGVCAPKVLVSEATLAMLNPRELRTALRHEIAHALRYDNLKKLVFRFSVFPAMVDLEDAWSEQTEMAADDAAVSSFPDALDLAAALIKVSRLGAIEPPGELTMALLHSSTALKARVQRLVAWDKPEAASRRKMDVCADCGRSDDGWCGDDLRLGPHPNARCNGMACALGSRPVRSSDTSPSVAPQQVKVRTRPLAPLCNAPFQN